MLPPLGITRHITFAVSYMEMLKILMLARVLHVKMSDASTDLGGDAQVRSWQQRVLAALGDGEENSKNDKKISEEHVEKLIEVQNIFWFRFRSLENSRICLNEVEIGSNDFSRLKTQDSKYLHSYVVVFSLSLF